MTPCRLRTAAVAACAAALLVGCGAATDSGVPAPSQTAPSAESPTASPGTVSPDALLDDLLAARSAGDPQRFAALVSQAATSCADPDASRSLGQLSAIAARWADSLAFARPKAQARTEAQLAEVDWAGLISACGTS
jgi:hypothetical protein